LKKYCLPFERFNQIYRSISIVSFMVFYFFKQQSLTGFQAIWLKRIKPTTILWAIPHDQVYPWTPYENIGSVDRRGFSYEARYDCCGAFMIAALGLGGIGV